MKYIFLLGLLSVQAYAQNLADSVPYPFHDVQKVSEGKSNQLMILNSGLASLEKRLEMIRGAKKNIEVEYFIYGQDDSSRIFTQELVKAAQRGVKVRMLIDKSAAIFEFDEFYAKVLAEYGIEVRYYNAAPLINVSTIQFRNHRKLLTVDDHLGMTGGRNIEDDYFDLSPKFNFLDTDVFVEGDIARTMRLSFDAYFEDKITERPKFPKKPKDTVWKTMPGGRERKLVSNIKNVKKFEDRLARVKAFMLPTEEDRELLGKVSIVGQEILSNHKMHECPETTYITDRPGGSFKTRLWEKYSDNYRFVRKALYDKISRADKSILLASPYMINNRYSHSLMDDLLAKKVEINLYTNSLASTDAVYVAANLYLDVMKWTRQGIKIHVHDGLYMDETPVINEEIKKAKWGVHTKAHVYESQDSSEIMIGTYNIDNRSNHYNSEMAIFCKGSEVLTQELKESILTRMENGYEITSDGKAINKNGEEVSMMGANPKDKYLMKLITLPSWLLKFLL